MKIKLIYLTGILFSGLLWSCEKEEPSYIKGEFEYMVFGHFYGECAGEGCVEIYKIQGGKLFEDSTDMYPNAQSPFVGQYFPLPDSKYDLVKDIILEFPGEIFSETDTIIGIPDGGDWGGIYVELKIDNGEFISGYWLLDQNEQNMPQVYNDFVDKINEKIELIHQ